MTKLPPSPSAAQIERLILSLRGQRVLLDFALAPLYQVEVRALNQAVRRNLDRFPGDFMFQLTPDEVDSLRSQSVILKTGRGGHSKYPAGTEARRSGKEVRRAIQGRLRRDPGADGTQGCKDEADRLRDLEGRLGRGNQAVNATGWAPLDWKRSTSKPAPGPTPRSAVILDSDLAGLYGVPTRRKNEQVRRNPGGSLRLPIDAARLL